MPQYGPIITSFDPRMRAWYWQSILRDGGSGGPFESETAALNDARLWAGDNENGN